MGISLAVFEVLFGYNFIFNLAAMYWCIKISQKITILQVKTAARYQHAVVSGHEVSMQSYYVSERIPSFEIQIVFLG